MIGIAVTVLVLGLIRWWQRAHVESSQDGPILQAARRYGVPPALVKAVVWRESKFDPMAQGRKGEIGLMQIMEPAAKEWAAAEKLKQFRHRQLFDPYLNTAAGTWYLKKLLGRYQETDNPLPYALADYNAGRSHVLRWAKEAAATNSEAFLAAITFPGTRDYVKSVMKRYEKYRDTAAPSN